MANGDSGRTWFPELVDELRVSWRPDLSWTAIIGLRDRLQAMVQEIIVTRGIKRARMRCFHCEIEPQESVDKFDKAWAKQRAKQQLDPRGQPVPARGPADHAHAEQE